MRPYFNRYTDDAVDLCDALSGFSRQGKATLHEICRVIGLPGKPTGVDGSEVAQYHQAGTTQEIANYCETDVLNTYRLWLRYEVVLWQPH
jgi:predicted PolB exonuclease-like 3'-5' exonuclease